MAGGGKGKEKKKTLAGILIANAVLLSAPYLGRAVDVLQIRARLQISHIVRSVLLLMGRKVLLIAGQRSRMRRGDVEMGG